ncbi:hypothetical protein WL32_16320 [Burkholderia cepacia]|nr:hypothetical protein WL32_16320 [Burkholderia cepacia]
MISFGPYRDPGPSAPAAVRRAVTPRIEAAARRTWRAAPSTANVCSRNSVHKRYANFDCPGIESRMRHGWKAF